MKRSLTIISLGVGMLATLSSCSSFHNGDTLGYEEAMPMSEVAIGDEELPPWVFEGDTSYQVPAGDRTPEMDRNHFATPEPGESMAVSNGIASQNQPAVAADDTVVDSHVGADFDPYAIPEAPPVSSTTTSSTPTTGAIAANTPKKTTPKKTSTKKKTAKKKVKKVSEPSLVVYKVRPGDNLYEIAKRSNTTIAQIRRDSGIKGDIIHPGQIIKVRFTPKGYKASKNKATPVNRTYVIKKGDMLSRVAARNGVSLASLLKANKMTMAQANKIQPGDKIIIPGKTSTVSKKKRRR